MDGEPEEERVGEWFWKKVEESDIGGGCVA